MRFGLVLPVQHPVQPLPGGAAALVREIVAFAAAAAGAGYHSLWAVQHFVTAPYQMLQPLPVLARLSGQVQGLTLGAGVLLLAFHHPVALAEETASLDALCAADGNRLVVGVGLGYRAEELAAFGMTRRQRLGRFEEALELLPMLWTQRDVKFQGRHFTCEGASISVPPVQQPRPPLWIGANSLAGIRRAARLADAWLINPHASLAALEDQLAVYRDELESCGKFEPQELPIMREVFVGPTRQAAIDACRPYLEGKYAAYQAWGQDEVMDGEERFNVGFEAMLEDRFIIGDAAYCREKIAEYQQRLGVTHLIARLHWPGLPMEQSLAALRLFGEEVVGKG